MKPLVARLICAAAALRDSSVGDLVARTGLSTTKISQLRSGARGDIKDAHLVLQTLGLDPDATIRCLEEKEAKHGGQLDAAIAALLLGFQRDAPFTVTSPGRICCDKVAITFPETVFQSSRKLVNFALATGKQIYKRHYRRAAMYGGVFIAAGLSWNGGRGIRLEFNPSKLSKRGLRVVRGVMSACSRTDDVRISRLDIAVDHEVPIGWFQVAGTRFKKNTTIGTSNGVETIYLGPKNAPISFAIYDKRKERGASGTAIAKPLTRIEARHKKRRLRPRDLVRIANPFIDLRLLWLDGEGLIFSDRVLMQLARSAGWPLLERELPRDHFMRLRDHFETKAKQRELVHPSDTFDVGWRSEARRLIRWLGLKS